MTTIAKSPPAAILLTFLVLALACGGGSPAPPLVGKIAFTSNRDGEFEIYSMEADGSNVSRLTNSGPPVEQYPAWSPDGSRIAFTLGQAIYVMNADGSSVTLLTDRGEEPAWSPDATRIAFMSGRDGPVEIYLMNADGSDVSRLTSHGRGTAYLSPSWSPDGAHITFAASGLDNDLYMMVADGSGLTRLTSDPSAELQPAWSPDGTRIVFRSNRDGDSIWVIDVDGSALARLTDLTAGLRDNNPSWSPDGARIVFADVRCRKGGCNTDIYGIEADGSNRFQLTNDPAEDTAPAWSAVH